MCSVAVHGGRLHRLDRSRMIRPPSGSTNRGGTAWDGVNAQDGLPITKFPRFYVTGWGGNGSNDDPCPDDDPALPGEIVGYFIAFGEPGGPVDETLSCIPGDLTPCRAVLVR